MIGIPVAVPLAWTSSGVFFLQAMRFCAEIGSDCLRYRGSFR